MGWSWEIGSPRERADMVRSHLGIGLTEDHLCDLFNLTPEGLLAIKRGLNWDFAFSQPTGGRK